MNLKKTIDQIPSYVFILIPIVLRVVNTALFKMAATSMDEFTLWEIATNALYILSFGLFFLRALSWQIALTKVPLSVAYPMLSVSFISLLAVGYFFFGETVSVYNVVGAVIIIAGVLTIIMGKKTETV